MLAVRCKVQATPTWLLVVIGCHRNTNYTVTVLYNYIIICIYIPFAQSPPLAPPLGSWRTGQTASRQQIGRPTLRPSVRPSPYDTVILRHFTFLRRRRDDERHQMRPVTHSSLVAGSRLFFDHFWALTCSISVQLSNFPLLIFVHRFPF